jgi:biopolymer transport protein ExbD
VQFGPVGLRTRRRWLSLTSLIDVVFLLLIFFMLTTSFSQQRMLDLDMPASQGKGRSAWQGGALVRVHADSLVDFNGLPLAVSEVSEKTRLLLQRRPQIRFIVRPDAGLPLQEVVSVMDQLRSGGAQRVSLVR